MGKDLSERIAASAKVDLDHWGTPANSLSFSILDLLRRKSDDIPKLNAWLGALRQITTGIHLKRSIDSFIDQHADDADIAQMGKLMIALRIVEAEARADALRLSDRGRLNLKNPVLEASWLDQFASMLFDGLRADALEDLGENLAVICFNYDRCIEHYLTHALINTYSVTDHEAARLVDRLNIVHPYGKLGSLGKVPFGPQNPDFWAISNNLKTFSESADTEIVEKTKAAILDAEQLVFLGFSFGRQNMELMTGADLHIRNPGKPAYASGFGVYEQQVDEVSRQIEQLYGHPLKLRRPSGHSVYTSIEVNVKARALLEVHWHNIMAG
ncbi:hypothetical protein [Devosia alba]|uniref:hypothetical protein n=1 Tax=Devosia alba TaxID=3152360 RepID=UPI0032653689